jgi:polysaccharide biosynthesis/export protein
MRSYQGFARALAACFVLLSGIVPIPLQAQQRAADQDTAAVQREAQRRLGRQVTSGEIVERIRQSGITRAQMRARLQQAGYDPGLADRYFDVLERGADPPRGDPSEEFLDALSRVGVTTRAEPAALREAIDNDTLPQLDRAALLDSIASEEVGVFGIRTFRGGTSQFEPVLVGPVGPGYRVGPGDELLLVLTGDVEAAYSLDVTREGFVFIPDVGQVQVGGFMIEELRDMLYSRLGRVYSGVTRSPSATTRFQLTLGQLRTSQVLVTGDVVMPGSYTISSVAGLFHALYQAGGPTENGSFRVVEIHRGGGLVERADLYSFLIGGSGTGDVRLEHNDRIFVPPVGSQIRVEGAVRRPAIYEVLPGESLTDLLRFAGGLRSDALVRRVQIDRIMPADVRTPGRYRSIIDIDLTAAEAAVTRLVDGDVVHVFAVNDDRRNRIWLEGGVRNPGIYEWQEGLTLWNLLGRADGLIESAYTPRAHILRLVEADGTRRLIRASLERDEAGRPLHDLALADNDSVVVLTRTELNTPEFVTISGFVKEPDTYRFAAGMTLKDLILAAGGFDHGAYVLEAEISRMPDPLQRNHVTAHVQTVSLIGPGDAPNGSDLRLPDWAPDPEDFELRHGDRVFIRRAPGYEPVREVFVTGQVLVPGTYVLAARDERLADIIARAGGLTEQAYAGGLHVVRSGRVLAADFERALERPDHRSNIQLARGDTIHVPAYDPTVLVSGAVNFESRVVFVPGRSVDYYINQAGGFNDSADRRRVTISYASGERSAVRRGTWIVSRPPPVRPGSQIFVPAVPEGRRSLNWDQVITRSAALLSATATILIAVQQLR